MSMDELDRPATSTGTEILQEYWRVVVRRKWVIFGAVVLSVAAAATFAHLSPKVYRSETLIFVENQKIPENYVRGLVAEGSLEQRIFAIKKQITTRALISEVVKESNLYPEVVAERGREAVIGMVARAVKVELVSDLPPGVPRNSVDAFTISFSHGNPETAMQVTTSLTYKFIEQTVKAREDIAQGTTEFLNREVLTAQTELEKKEDQISRFKAAHLSELPQQMEANMRALDRLQSDLNTVNEVTQRNRDRLALLEKAIQEYEQFGSTNMSLAGVVKPDVLFERYEELRKRLAALSAQFTESYPDTVMTKEELRQVESELVERYGPDAIRPSEKRLDPYLQELKKQQSEVKSELTLLGQRLRLLQSEKGAYEKRIERAPAVEQELLILERDYGNMKNSYRSLLDKWIDARVSENLEKRQQGGQYRIIETANFPREPESPNRVRIMVFGLLFGCALGAAIAAIQEQSNVQFRRPEDVEQLLGPQLLAVIPDFSFPRAAGMPWQRFLPYSQQKKSVAGHDSRQDTRWRLLAKSNSLVSMEPELIVKWQPASMGAEQYRVAATRLALMKPDDGCTIIGVTSAVKGEGKTTTVVNLGYTIARDLGKRTLLMDCDFKCPMLHRYGPMVQEYGLGDCLMSDVAVDACMTGLAEVPCWIMPVGNTAVPSNHILKTERLAAVLHQLRAQFDYILMNMPPILPLADMNVLSPHADALLLVVRADSTPQEFVRRAVTTLGTRAPIHVILNAAGTLPHYMHDYGYAYRA
jgi:polysaccharide biosynthesis transport protein